jgi:enamine deaminase RidA (YjgF/YER057c/UK114 family)
MSVEAIFAPSLAAPSGPYSAATLASGSRVLSISGQVAQSATGDPIAPGSAGGQAAHCLQQIDALLLAAGACRTDVVKISIFLTDMNDRPSVARAREEYFGEHHPAATLVEVTGLVSPDYVVEIEATAVF